MGEEIVAEDEAGLLVAQEGALLVGDGGVQLFAGPGPPVRVGLQHRRGHAPGHQGLAPAIVAPARPEIGLGQEGLHPVLVVAAQEASLVSGLALQPDQAVDDAARVRAAIDVVAQEDHDPARGGRRRQVRLDRRHQGLQQVQPAVDVAHRPDDGAGGRGGRGGAADRRGGRTASEKLADHAAGMGREGRAGKRPAP